jgi:hypothetical protein
MLLQSYPPQRLPRLTQLKAEHESGLPAAHYRYTRGKTRGYETHGSELLVIAGLCGSGCFFWCCEYLPQVLMRLRFFLT